MVKTLVRDLLHANIFSEQTLLIKKKHHESWIVSIY